MSQETKRLGLSGRPRRLGDLNGGRVKVWEKTSVRPLPLRRGVHTVSGRPYKVTTKDSRRLNPREKVRKSEGGCDVDVL